MPYYDYHCNICAEVFEEEHPMDFVGIVICPACDGGDTNKIFLSCAAIRIAWQDPRSSSDVSGLQPKFLSAVRRPRRSRPTVTASDLEGPMTRPLDVPAASPPS